MVGVKKVLCIDRQFEKGGKLGKGKTDSTSA